MNDTQRYLTKLFLPKENICYTSHVKGTSVMSLEKSLEIVEPYNFVCLNPLDGKQDLAPYRAYHYPFVPRRADENLTQRRNFLIEFDSGTLEEQSKNILDFDLPYTTLTYSGGKSLHAVIALTESVSAEDYAQYFDLIKIVMWKLDSSCRNPSKLTRVAGANRDGKIQDLVDIRRRISVDKLVTWLARFETRIEKALKQQAAESAKKVEYLENAKASGAVGIELLNPSTISFLKGDAGNTSSRHNRLYAIACHMFELGIDYDEIHGHITSAAELLGITADRARRSEAESIVKAAFKQLLRKA